MNLDRATKEFQETLRRKASEKKTRALADAKRDRQPGMRKMSPQSMPTMLNEMRAQLNEIKELLKQYKIGDAMPVKFVVTERDATGKIIAFKVERT